MTLPDDEDNVVADFEAFRRSREASRGGRPPSGGGPTDHTERRIDALEQGIEKIAGKLDKLIESFGETRLSNEQRFGIFGEKLAAIEGKLDAKAAASELAEVKGRTNSLPTAWQMLLMIASTVFTILGGAFLILKFGLPHVP